MNQSEFIANRLQEVLLDGKWIANTNYKELLEATDWMQATQKIDSLNTIALLTFHINYYLAGLLEVLNGGELTIRDKYSFDAPPIQSEEDWQALKSTFYSNATEFIDKIKNLPEAQLSEPFVNEKYGTYQRNLEGVIEHSYYHLGQISLIKKMQKS